MMWPNKIVTYPDRILDTRTKEVQYSPELKGLAIHMYNLMIGNNGIGLACNQIGLDKRMCVVQFETGAWGTLINPQILEFYGKEIEEVEGCLSFPGRKERVSRPFNIKVQYMNFNGVKRTEDFSGRDARVIQHELEHLDGHNFMREKK